MEQQLLHRITINSNIRNGTPVVRNMRFTVSEILGLLATGMSKDDILNDYKFLESEDIDACILYASKVLNNETEELAKVL